MLKTVAGGTLWAMMDGRSIRLKDERARSPRSRRWMYSSRTVWSTSSTPWFYLT